MALPISEKARANVRPRGTVWRPQSWYLAPVTVIVACFSLFGRQEFAHSAIWAVDAALTSLYVLWPIALGVSAVPIVRLRRTASRELLDALPTGAQWRAMVASAAAPGIWICAGLVLASGLALGVAAGHGSPPSWQAVIPVVPALIGTLAMSALGGLSAVAVPRWFLPPLLTVVAFVLLVFDVAGLRVLTDFVGATSSVVVAMQVRTAVLLGLCAVFTALVLACLTFSAALVTDLRRWCFVGISAAGVAVLVLLATDLRGPWTWTDDASWPCTPVPATDTEVCLPPDQQRLTEVVSSALAPIATRLGEVDPGLRTARFSASAAAGSEGRQRILITLPVGRPEDATDELVASVTNGLAVCWETDHSAADELVLARAMIVLQWWLVPQQVPDPVLLEAYEIVDRAPTRVEAEHAYSTLTECGR